METYTPMMCRHYATEQKEKMKAILKTLGEAAMSTVFFILVFGMCFLCTICSGYHWE